MSDDGAPSRRPPPAGPEHDAWLREALRHAPDAGAAPPATLRDAILAEARAATLTAATPAVRAASPASLLDRLLDFWSWLARPQVAAGFASVMAATLVGMLWWDRPLDETGVPSPSTPPAAAPARLEKQSPALAEDRSPRSVLPPAASAIGDGTGATTRPPASTAPAVATTEERARRAQGSQRAAEQAAPLREGAKAKAVAEESKDRAPKRDATPGTATTPVPTPFPARAPVDDDLAARRTAPQEAPPSTPPAPAPAAAPTPTPAAPPMQAAAPAPTATPPAAAPGRAEPFALAKKAERSDKEAATASARSAAPVAASPAPAPGGSLGRSTLDSSEASAAGRIAARNAAEAGPRQRDAIAAPSQPMAPLLSALASEGSRWTRARAGAESVPVDAATRAWLAQVQAAAARWEAMAEGGGGRDAPASATGPSTILRLDRDGRIGAIVQVEDAGVRFDALAGTAWFAPMQAEVVARLRATLPPAVR